MGKLGLMAINIPESLGGTGLDHVAYCIAMEEISRFVLTTKILLFNIFPNYTLLII